MELINTSNGQFKDADPATLTSGTPISASWANNIQGEIAAVITDRGGILDGTKTNQMSAAITSQLNGYLPLTGGTITGSLNIQTVSATDNSTNAASTAFVQGLISTETARAEAAESTLQGNINTETTARENADALLLPRTGGTITGNIVVNGSMDRDGPISDVPGVTGTAVPNTSWVDTNYVSSTRYMVSGDSACDGLHYSSGATAPWFHSGSWSGNLATQDWSNGIFQAASDFAGSTETCINLPCGIRIQTWSINLVTSSAQARVNFPVAFSAGPSCVLVTSSAGDMDTWTTAWDSSGFTMHVPSDSQIQNGNVSILAVGPK